MSTVWSGQSGRVCPGSLRLNSPPGGQDLGGKPPGGGGVGRPMDERMLQPCCMGAIEGNPLGDKGVSPIPEVFVYDVGLNPSANLVALTDINGGKLVNGSLCNPAWNIYARTCELTAFRNARPRRPRERDPNARTVQVVDDFDSVGITL